MDREGDAEPSSWENEGFAGFLPPLITCRQCDDAVGEGRWFKGLTVDLGWRGRRWGRGPAGVQASPGSGGEGTSLMDDLPPFDEMVKVVLSLPSYNSSNK